MNANIVKWAGQRRLPYNGERDVEMVMNTVERFRDDMSLKLKNFKLIRW
ncbi:MAG: hypothetical protein LBJ95_00865 [Oscillospiraceae bacterium]|nr:hypothetical protein [Oscillospiraceae bacterium]